MAHHISSPSSLFAFSSLANAAVSLFNGHKQRALQRIQAEEARKIRAIEFKETQLHNEHLAKLSHDYRLKEQKEYFNSLLESKDYDYTLVNAWPLKEAPSSYPSLIHIVDGKVPLQVFFAKSNNAQGFKELFLNSMHDLKSFFNKYYKQQLLFYHDNWKYEKDVYDQTAITEIYRFWKGLPTLLIMPAFSNGKIDLWLTYWGLGLNEGYENIQIFSETYTKIDDNFRLKILTLLKIYTSIITDIYWRIEYGCKPQLPLILSELDFNQIFDEVKEQLDIEEICLKLENQNNMFKQNTNNGTNNNLKKDKVDDDIFTL